MTKFLDGPAQGNTLMLKRAVLLLRVVTKDGKTWDALDQPEDTPAPDEKIQVYALKEHRGNCHVKLGGQAKNASGFYPMSDYVLCKIQPDDIVARDAGKWSAWCHAHDSQIFNRDGSLK